jgi:DNA-binding transcriptional regulator/RsmH inhibitor MraZ
MDPKFRVSVPVLWRPEAGALLFLMFSKEHGMPVVKVLSQEAYDEKVEIIRTSDKTPAEKGKMLGKLAMRCREASLNEQGKLLVPKDLSETAGIAADSDVMLAGRGISRSGARRTSTRCSKSKPARKKKTISAFSNHSHPRHTQQQQCCSPNQPWRLKRSAMRRLRSPSPRLQGWELFSYRRMAHSGQRGILSGTRTSAPLLAGCRCGVR